VKRRLQEKMPPGHGGDDSARHACGQAAYKRGKVTRNTFHDRRTEGLDIYRGRRGNVEGISKERLQGGEKINAGDGGRGVGMCQ